MCRFIYHETTFANLLSILQFIHFRVPKPKVAHVFLCIECLKEHHEFEPNP